MTKNQEGFNEFRICRHGPMLFNKHDIYIGRALQKYGESNWLEFELFQQVLRPGQIAVEVGANIGVHTIGLAKLVAPDGAVFAFEPQRIVFQTLCANLALNQCVNVYAFQEALGASAGELLVPAPDPRVSNNFGGISLVGATRGEKVRVDTVDGLGLHACHLLKVDVEGMEIEVLKGARQAIDKFRPALYVENDRVAQSKALIEFVFSLDYKAYWHLPPLFNAKNFAGDPENLFPGFVSVNMLCVPTESSFVVQDMRRVVSADERWNA